MFHPEGNTFVGRMEPLGDRAFDTLSARLDGRVLLVEGLHKTPDRTRVVHHAFGVFTWDEKEKHYRFDTYVANRGGGGGR